jgi:anthranilate synthase component 1
MDPMEALRAELSGFRPAPVPGLPRFSGGLVGFLGYEASHAFEPSVPRLSGQSGSQAGLPDAYFLLADTVVAFDHAFGRLLLIANIHLNGEVGSLEEARSLGNQRLDELEQRLSGPLPLNDAVSRRSDALDRRSDALDRPSPPADQELRANTSHDRFIQAVLEAKEHIAAGDIFQVVLSQRFSRRTTANPFNIYRALRRLNPSPYMFFFDLPDPEGNTPPLRLIGASPEMHVRLEGRRASLRPIAGTRRRGETLDQDAALEQDLLSDPKERAEHVMLVDLGRNDLGRVCEYGSVSVSELMAVERYSHVMHIVSQVDGLLKPEYDGFDLLRATFPAGTVSGAPKIRAMQIIAELEREPRGPYAGAVGYFSYDGSLDTCITIRTLLMQDQVVSIQAGAGIVADSDPEQEFQETLNKARALSVAVEMAEKGD